MRNIILGTIAGLAIGTIGALAYSHYFGDGSLLDDLQSQLDAANAKLAKATKDKRYMAEETSGVSDQINQLQATNDDLKRQLDTAKKSPDTSAITPMTLANILRNAFRGGAQGQQRLLLLQTRLKLTPDQQAKIKAAMDADAQARRSLMQQMFRNNGAVDPAAAAAANTLDQTLADVLTPEQKTAYQQLQTDEQSSRADMAATAQVDQMMPLLQLSDSQKEQVYNALYQAQATAPDPTTLITNPNAASVIASQAQTTQAALAKVLTPDQMALYQQQAQMAPAFGGFRGGGGGGGNGGGGNGGGGNGGGAANPSSNGGASTSTGGTTTSGYVMPPGGTTTSVVTTVTSGVVNPDGSVTPISTSVTPVSTNTAPVNAAPGQ
ncbi:MAG TPA: hypothetical protein VGZ93_03940 [Candidatus Methylacidiphilales bacterium]|jgi:Spy/CpxP family protein refolding chaperone|nr:hypothetical protein [Candidatus Methylacidiphilales bacterium]